ncbi:unnamed protein product [Nezara viridula]|uniref:MADF domain-containing protein n=1 Tax=Nezara viridula TaxID=85310 RepID=A0A9P0HEX6_NEZVI|nr:unnamed protein product [Nezara viridula]
MEKKKRKRIKSFNKWWTKEDTLVFLRKVLENKNTFEKPSAQIFYKKIIVEEDSLAEYSWREMRDRMRNLKKKYKDALTWKVNTRVLHLDYKSETAVVNYMLRLCPFFKEIDEICRGNANVPSPLVSDSTNSVSVLEGGGNFKGVVITESEEEYPLNQPSWVATTATPLQPEDQLETPSLHGRISYKEIVSGNPGMESVKVPPNYLTQVFHSENSKQQSEIEVECLSSSNHSERIQPATLQIASKIDTSGKTNRKLSQPLPSSSKNKKTPFDHEVRANDELEEMPKRSTLVTVNKVDNFDHFGKYVSSILRNLRKQSALRLQKNISNMITKTICRPADFSKNNNADGDIEDDEDHCYVGHITTINTSTMIVSSLFFYSFTTFQ